MRDGGTTLARGRGRSAWVDYLSTTAHARIGIMVSDPPDRKKAGSPLLKWVIGGPTL